MVCSGCHSADVQPIPLFFCGFCGRLVTRADVDKFHREMVAPRAALEAQRLDDALREGGG